MTPQTQTLFTQAGDDGSSLLRHQLAQRAKSGAHWFYWIAALSLVTSIISLAGGRWGFFASLGVTQFFDAVAAQALAPRVGEGVKVVAFAFDLFAVGVFAALGYFAAKRQTWAFVVGMTLYLLDALLFLALLFLAQSFQGLLVLAFHAYVLYSIFGGYKACARLAETGGDVPPPPVATPV